MASTRIRTVCFDFDGTLAFMRPSHWALYAEAARAAGIVVSEEALAAQATDDAWAPWMTPLGPVHLDASKSQAAFRALRADLAGDRLRAAGVQDEARLTEAGRVAALLEEEAARYVLFDDTVPALQRLADAGIDSIIVSNHIWTLPEIVEDRGLGALVHATVTSAREGVRKPHPAIFSAALRHTSTPPEAIVMVGDSMSADVRGAEAAGMHAVFIDREGTRTVPQDVRVIRSLLEVPLEWSAL
ncbi:MAG: HAD family hydrolase [Chloroflexota bacterium]